MKAAVRALVGLSLCTPLALAVPATIDGSRDASYPAALAVQDTQTQFGNATTGLPGRCTGGSELDNLHAYVEDCKLYIILGGNLETNGNDLELFFDTRAGGQNRLRSDNPVIPAGPNDNADGLNRMGPSTEFNGLSFESDFEADFWLSIQNTVRVADNSTIRVRYAELRIDADHPGIGYFVGEGRASDEQAGDFVNGGLTGGTNPHDIRVCINNSNVAGVDGGTGALVDTTAPAAVTTGIEICIPLSALGLPNGDFKMVAFVNGGSHDFLSNQILPGLFGGGNLGDPRSTNGVNFALVGNFLPQQVTISNATPCGSCCVLGVCSTVEEANCSGDWTAFQACLPNPCATPEGACCHPDFTCTFVTGADCAAAGGTYQGDGVLCVAGLCAVGACCTGETCTAVSPIVCSGVGGDYLGDGSTCSPNPCARGACCVIGRYCLEMRASSCTGDGFTYLGNGVPCTPGACGGSADQPVVDGTADASYGAGLCVQNVGTQFGDSNLGTPDGANGSELDVMFGRVVDGRLYLTLAGNLETNFNKLDIFFDSRAGGQNRLRGDNPDVDFNGLNRMGDDGTGNGLTFDADFEADFYIQVTAGGSPVTLFTSYAELGNPGVGRYLGSTGAVSNGLLGGGNNPDVVLMTFNNSNVMGVPGGGAAADGSGVTTGVEISVPLASLGNPTGDIKVCAFINGTGHDFLSNQVLGPLGEAGSGNLGEPRLVNFEFVAGSQYCTVPNAAALRGDANCDGLINFDDIDCFVAALISSEAWDACGHGAGCTYVGVNDIDGNSAVNFDDIDPFIVCLIMGSCP